MGTDKKNLLERFPSKLETVISPETSDTVTKIWQVAMIVYKKGYDLLHIVSICVVFQGQPDSTVAYKTFPFHLQDFNDIYTKYILKSDLAQQEIDTYFVSASTQCGRAFLSSAFV